MAVSMICRRAVTICADAGVQTIYRLATAFAFAYAYGATVIVCYQSGEMPAV